MGKSNWVGFFVQDRKRTGKAKTDRTCVGVGGCIVVIGRAATEHFGLKFVKLDVDFKPDPYAVRVLVGHLRHLRRSLCVVISILLESIGCTQNRGFVKGFAHYLESDGQSISKTTGHGN